MTVMVTYVPCNDREEEAKDALLREIERVIEAVDAREKLFDRGDLNRWVGDRRE